MFTSYARKMGDFVPQSRIAENTSFECGDLCGTSLSKSRDNANKGFNVPQVKE